MPLLDDMTPEQIEALKRLQVTSLAGMSTAQKVAQYNRFNTGQAGPNERLDLGKIEGIEDVTPPYSPLPETGAAQATAPPPNYSKLRPQDSEAVVSPTRYETVGPGGAFATSLSNFGPATAEQIQNMIRLPGDPPGPTIIGAGRSGAPPGPTIIGAGRSIDAPAGNGGVNAGVAQTQPRGGLLDDYRRYLRDRQAMNGGGAGDLKEAALQYNDLVNARQKAQDLASQQEYNRGNLAVAAAKVNLDQNKQAFEQGKDAFTSNLLGTLAKLNVPPEQARAIVTAYQKLHPQFNTGRAAYQPAPLVFDWQKEVSGVPAGQGLGATPEQAVTPAPQAGAGAPPQDIRIRTSRGGATPGGVEPNPNYNEPPQTDFNEELGGRAVEAAHALTLNKEGKRVVPSAEDFLVGLHRAVGGGAVGDELFARKLPQVLELARTKGVPEKSLQDFINPGTMSYLLQRRLFSNPSEGEVLSSKIRNKLKGANGPGLPGGDNESVLSRWLLKRMEDVGYATQALNPF